MSHFSYFVKRKTAKPVDTLPNIVDFYLRYS